MDDIYGDLDNYDNVNVIDELRNENKELKFKLQEYGSTIAKLQKDFDKLSLEYKKLEINYSSLLKTARAEVERKTQIIANLNNEKDMMVLNAIQNSNPNRFLRRNALRGRSKSNNRKSGKDTELETKPSRSTKEYSEANRFELERERNEEVRLPSTDTVLSGNTNSTDKVNEDKITKLEAYDKLSESKENVKGKRAQSLKSRRKSMPAIGKRIPKFSSDEEYEENYSGDEVNKRERLSRDDKTRKTFDRHKQSHKISETSGIDEKYSSYHESSRETYYKGKLTRYSDKYRTPRDRYEAQRHNKHFSPERNRRGPRDYSDNQNQHQEYRRHRVLESPSVERYDSQHRQRDRRSNYEKDSTYDERNTRRHERVAIKHKCTSDYDEPNSKRARTDSCSKLAGEDVRWHKEHSVRQEKSIPEFSKHLQHMSCQSPDYIYPDAVSNHPIKEIMNTASTKLEDPRLANKNYVKNIEGDQVTLSTVAGRNVDIKSIDMSKWNIPKVDVPQALQKPPQYTDDLVKTLYMDIDNPVSNMSMASGEIHSETNDAHFTDYVTESFMQDYENERINQLSTIYDNPVKDKPEDTNNKNKEDNVEPKTPKTEIKNLKRVEETTSALPNPLGVLLNELHTVCGLPPDKMVKIRTDECKLNVDDLFDTEDENPHDKSNDKSKRPRKVGDRRKLSARELVEGDLELSDDTSDFVDIKKHIKQEKSKEPASSNKCKDSNKTKNEKNIIKSNKNQTKKEEDSRKSQTGIIIKIKNVEKGSGEKYKVVSDDKKTKKKPVKQKEATTKDSIENSEAEKVPVKKPRGRKPKESKPPDKNEKKTKGKHPKENKIQDHKAKFTDLFGDSSSLVTPEDLGFAAVETQLECKKIYLPISEDAQDAIDVNVKVTAETQELSAKLPEDISIVETLPSITKTTPTNNTIEAKVENTKEQTKTHEVCLSVQEMTPNMEVLNTEVLKEPDIVKTVIISTGVQPRIESMEQNKEVDENQDAHDVVTDIQNIPVLALATSTPYKKHSLLETDIDSSCYSNNSVQKEILTDQSSMSNGVEAIKSNNDDEPDVRIFVKRRRKFKK